jgi:small-conductance mechanosensitive channel
MERCKAAHGKSANGFIKRIHERFAREGIVIPYPIRALNFDQEKRE